MVNNRSMPGERAAESSHLAIRLILLINTRFTKLVDVFLVNAPKGCAPPRSCTPIVPDG